MQSPLMEIVVIGNQVMLAGNADKSGSASYNVGLSQRRNESVRAYLVSRGINATV